MKLSDYGYNALAIETLHKCNMKCQFCPYPNVNPVGSTLPTEVFYKIIDELEPDNNLEKICLAKYNEPLLDPRIYQFNEYVKNKGLKTEIITNGLLFSSQTHVNQLLNSEPTYLLISLHIFDSENFERIRGTKTSFENYKNNLFRFLSDYLNSGCKTRITIDIGCNFLSDSFFSKNGKLTTKLLGIEKGHPTVSDSIDDFQDDLLDFLKELRSYNSLFRFDENNLINLLKTTSQESYFREPELKLSDNIFIKIKQFIYSNRHTEFYSTFVPVGCKSTTLSINSLGNVAPCCIDNNMLSVGNVKTDSLKNILDNSLDTVLEIRKGSKIPNLCKKCQGAPTRRGVLFISFYRFLQKVAKNS